MNDIRQGLEFLKTLTVLYVEDEELTRQMTSHYLSRNTGMLITAENGAEGLEAFQTHRPDIVITDIQMPLKDGLSMVREIREIDKTVPTIVLTAFDSADLLMKSINIGVDRYINKPVDIQLFQEALSTCAYRLFVEENLKQVQSTLTNERQRLAKIIEGARVGTWEWNIQTGETVFNEQWADMIGYTLDEISPVSINTWRDFTHPDDLKKSNELLQQYFQGEHKYYECEVRMKHKNGEWIWVLDRGKVASWSEDGKQLSMFGTHQDISKRKLIEEAVICAKKEWEQTFDAVSDLISIIDTNHTIVRVNRAMAHCFGLTPQEMIGRKCHEIFHCTSEPIPNCPYEKVMKDKLEHTVEVDESRLKSIFDITVSPIYESEGYLKQCVHLVRDVTEQKNLEEELHQAKAVAEALSKTDGLTGLANRRNFDETFNKEFARHTRSGLSFSLILLDIDHFKKFNDTYGHVAGDVCLSKVAQVIAECKNRPNDLGARYGGEEFACILPETDQRGALLIAERIRNGIIDLAIPHAGSDVAGYVTASLGVVTVLGSLDKTGTDIVAQADELLYRAKSLGRNRVVCNEGG